jgi:RNA polymerase sigma-70 factor (ECF subfamily)
MTVDELATQFITIQGELKSFLLRMTTSVQDTEDIVQDTYIKAQAKIDTFRGESSLKTWIFSIASNLARDLLRSKKRWPETVTDICREETLGNRQFFREAIHIRETSPQGNFEIREHIAFCFTCIAKSLSLDGHLVLLLKEVYGFKVREISHILEMSEAMVKYHLHVSRSRMIEIFDQRCSLVNKQGICHQCTELNGIFNPKQKAQEELVKIEMAREAENRSSNDLFDLRMKILRELDPFSSGASELQLHHLEHNRQIMDKYLNEKQCIAYHFLAPNRLKRKGV